MVFVAKYDRDDDELFRKGLYEPSRMIECLSGMPEKCSALQKK